MSEEIDLSIFEEDMWERIHKDVHSLEDSDVIKEVVEKEHEIYLLRTKEKDINLLRGGYNEHFSQLLRSCIKEYCKRMVPKNVSFSCVPHNHFNENFKKKMAMIPMRGAVPKISDESIPYEICIFIDNLPEDFDNVKKGGKVVRGIRSSKYLSDPNYVEKVIMCFMVKGIGNEILKNIAYFGDCDCVNSETIKCEINNCQTLIELEPKRLRFWVVGAINARVYSEVSSDCHAIEEALEEGI